MGLGTNRDYKTRDRRASSLLRKHSERMRELMAQGLSREEASKKAFEELRGNHHRKESRGK